MDGEDVEGIMDVGTDRERWSVLTGRGGRYSQGEVGVYSQGEVVRTHRERKKLLTRRGE
jgi:hypothetical protein